MDISQLLRSLGLPQAYQAYQQNIGEPFAAMVGGAGRGYLGFDRPDYGGLLAEESYRTGQALGNMPGIGAPAGAFKVGAQAAAQVPSLLADAVQMMKANPEAGLLASVVPGASRIFKTSDIPEKEGFLRLYHGGGDSGFEKVPEGGRFDGFFALPESVGGHGIGHNYFADIPREKILTNYELNYELPLNKVIESFEKTTGIKQSDPEFNFAWKAIIEETKDANEMALAAKLADEYGEAGWEAQKLRGRIAKRLGYDAIEMNDEHGISYLITSGVPLKYIGSANE